MSGDPRSGAGTIESITGGSQFPDPVPAADPVPTEPVTSVVPFPSTPSSAVPSVNDPVPTTPLPPALPVGCARAPPPAAPAPIVTVAASAATTIRTPKPRPWIGMSGTLTAQTYRSALSFVHVGAQIGFD